jgi:translation initiation factor 2 alpha subunit (eIF-2alpha)
MEFSKRKICENNMNKKLSMYKKKTRQTQFLHILASCLETVATFILCQGSLSSEEPVN